MAIGILIGGLITWFSSKYFYEKAAEDLKIEAEEFRKKMAELYELTNFLSLGMESMGWLSVKRDEHGKARSYDFKLKVHDGVSQVSSTSPSLTQSEGDKKGGEPA